MNLLRTLQLLASRTRDNGKSTNDLALASRSVLNSSDAEVLPGDNLPLALTNLLASNGAAQAVVNAIESNPAAVQALAKALAGANE